MKRKIIILNGPGFSGISDVQGKAFAGLTIESINKQCSSHGEALGIDIDFRQTEDLDELRRWIKDDGKDCDGLVINPGVRSSSAGDPIAADPLLFPEIASLKKPVVEVRIENIFSQGTATVGPIHEPGGDIGFVCGLGIESYLLGIRSLAHRFESAAAASRS